ncbi:DUF3168 domain-containing protein [Caldanaerobacter sp.]|uniref:DUF3168 domain-containing protein n=1 Tax=Caldanaerobacter sp. TaxID=2930036 RepID=UPI003C728CEA
MMLEQAIYGYVSTHAGVTALVGNRIYPLLLPQNPTYPAIVYSRVSRIYEKDLSGTVWNQSRIQFSCYAKKYSEAKAVAEQLRSAFRDYRGKIGDIDIMVADVTNEIDLYEPDTALFNVSIDVLIKHKGGN